MDLWKAIFAKEKNFIKIFGLFANKNVLKKASTKTVLISETHIESTLNFHSFTTRKMNMEKFNLH
jgi:hypothetical protein